MFWVGSSPEGFTEITARILIVLFDPINISVQEVEAITPHVRLHTLVYHIWLESWILTCGWYNMVYYGFIYLTTVMTKVSNVGK